MTQSDSRVAVYTGSFDPITLGHLNVIERAAKLVDRLIVGIGINVEKAALFSPEERVALVGQTTAHLKNVEVRAFANLAVDFVRECGSRVMIRGVRPYPVHFEDLPREVRQLIHVVLMVGIQQLSSRVVASEEWLLVVQVR